jgi:hypothetical protein
MDEDWLIQNLKGEIRYVNYIHMDVIDISYDVIM